MRKTYPKQHLHISTTFILLHLRMPWESNTLREMVQYIGNLPKRHWHLLQSLVKISRSLASFIVSDAPIYDRITSRIVRHPVQNARLIDERRHSTNPITHSEIKNEFTLVRLLPIKMLCREVAMICIYQRCTSYAMSCKRLLLSNWMLPTTTVWRFAP